MSLAGHASFRLSFLFISQESLFSANVLRHSGVYGITTLPLFQVSAAADLFLFQFYHEDTLIERYRRGAAGAFPRARRAIRRFTVRGCRQSARSRCRTLTSQPVPGFRLVISLVGCAYAAPAIYGGGELAA